MVIIGSGMAGGTAAATLREEGFGGPVVIISREPGIPLGRPPLSKTYLRSEEDLAGWYVRPAGWYETHDVDLYAESAVTAIDAAAHRLVLDTGRELEYEKVLIATGGRNRQLGGSGGWAARDLLSADGGRVRRDQAGSVGRPARGRGRHGVHRLRGGGVPAAAGGRCDRGLAWRNPLERVLGEQIGDLIGAIHRSQRSQADGRGSGCRV